MAIITSMFKNAVVPIGIRQKDSSIAWIGTGFLVVKGTSAGDYNPYLISNRHVMSGCSSFVYAMKEAGTDNVKILEALSVGADGRPLFRAHPNSSIDIAVLPVDAAYIRKEKVIFPAFDIDKNAMTSKELREAGVDDGSLVYMLGFTLGLVNNTSKSPLCRLGCIARMSEQQINEQFNILVDIQNFPGNSGSPIILRPEFFSVDGTKSLNRNVLVGIVHSYIPYQDQLQSVQSKKVVEVRTENSGIALVHPVEYIKEIIDSFYV